MDTTDLPQSLIAQAATLRASGFFDEPYYRVRRSGLAADMDAAVDYLLNGGGVAPGPLFDPAGYLLKYPDVAEANLNPLLHYLNHGRAEGRSNVFASEHLPGEKPHLTVPLPPARRDIRKLAVVVRAVHLDGMAAVCKSLAAIPGHFALLVAVPTEAAKSIVESAVAQAGLDVRLECRVVSDKERVFAAMFSEFAQEILQHEYVFQLCSSKQQPSKSDRHPAGSLVHSEPLVDTIIQTFETHANVGLIYPSPPRARLGWMQRWFSKEDTARKFLAKVGVVFDAVDDDISYPAGGEFWARVDSFRPIFEAGLSYSDFPEGRGKADDALAHGLMRAVATVARARQYVFVEYDGKTGTLRLDRGARARGPYFTGTMDKFSRLVFETELVSFDVFDTLLIRDSVTPNSVQRYAGFLLNGIYPETASDFFSRRKGAEHSARAEKSFQGDVGLSEIYKKFERTPVWTEEVIALARKLEEATDARSLRKRPEVEDMLHFAKHQGKRLIVLSDTYYSTDQVRSLLAREGLADFFDEFYVSSDQNARKDHGDLWDKVLASERIAPSRWLHVGDNEHSDIQAASDRKLKHLHLARPGAFLERAGLDFKSPESVWATDLIMGPVANRLAANASTAGTSGRVQPLKDAEEVGFCILGPVVFAFLHWIVNHPSLGSVSSIHFLSREGFLLHRIYRQLCARYPDLSLPPGSYLYASRRATLSASLGIEFAPHRLVSEARFKGTIAELLHQRIGVELTDELDVASGLITLPDDEGRVLEALQILKPQIAAHASDELWAYRLYLEQAGLMNSSSPAVVDIGYSATIQTSLQLIAERPMIGFYLGTFPMAHQVEERGGRAFGYLVQDMLPGSASEPVMAYSLLMEALLIAPHGQLLAIHADGDKTTPIFRVPTHDRRSADVLAAIHDGAVRYCSNLMDIYGASIWRTVIDKRAPQEPFRALVEGLLDIPPELKSDIHVEDDFCGFGIWKPLDTPTPPWKT